MSTAAAIGWTVDTVGMGATGCLVATAGGAGRNSLACLARMLHTTPTPVFKAVPGLVTANTKARQPSCF